MASKVHQVSRAPRALVGRTAVLTRCPGKLGRVNEGPRGGTALLGTRDSTRGLAGSTSCPGRLALVSEGPWC